MTEIKTRYSVIVKMTASSVAWLYVANLELASRGPLPVTLIEIPSGEVYVNCENCMIFKILHLFLDYSDLFHSSESGLITVTTTA
jgi:hypothetical protein